MFTAYTYLAYLPERVARVPPAQVGWWLMGFGAVGLAGNWLGGRYVDRHPAGATAAFVLLLGIGMAASVPLASSTRGLVTALARTPRPTCLDHGQTACSPGDGICMEN
ncbi:hypothetical protein [Burkholderia ubonensis]|uniref:hypothetical protein n=1 Tax=Burkholderia ubonensis TaxID=101571 RepID=UPI0039F21CF8